jgi:DNA topoisomerase-1
VKKVKKEAKAKKVEEEEEVYRWWAEEAERNDSNEPGDDGVRWTSLAHYGVLFPPEYIPHGIQMKYDGKPVTLTPEAEEVASFFAALLETDHGKNPTFQKNFFADFKTVLAKSPKVKKKKKKKKSGSI